MTDLGKRLAILNAKSNLDAWQAKPWHIESVTWVEFWKAKLKELRA